MTTKDISRIVAEAVTCLRNCNEELAASGRYSRRIENAASALEAAQPPSNAVPDGYVVVPRIVTREMLIAYWTNGGENELDPSLLTNGDMRVLQRDWDNLLAAAQEQP